MSCVRTTSRTDGRLLTRRLVQLFLGFAAFGGGIGLMVRAEVGVPPWDVLALGLARVTGQEFGTMTVAISLAVMLFWIPLRQRPGLGTVLNALLVGVFAQATIWLMPAVTDLLVRIPLFAAGLLLVAIGSGLYIGAGFGPGPRDGLMTGLHDRTGLPIWLVRTALEATALAIGWALGGNVGFGTLAFALLIGPLVQPALRRLDLRPRVAAARAARAAAEAEAQAVRAAEAEPGQDR